MKRDRVAEIHFYEWRIGAWAISETRDRLDATGRGIYRELLDQCYGAGKIPDDAEWICRRCACTMDQYEKAWKVISRHFPMINGTEYRYNVKADLMRSEYFKYVEKQRINRSHRTDKSKEINEVYDGGSTVEEPSGQHVSNGGSTNGNGNGNTTATANKDQNLCATDVARDGALFVLNAPVAETGSRRPKKVFYDEHFPVWYEAFWNHKGRTPGRKAYEKAINKLVDDKKAVGYNAARLFLFEQVVGFRKRFEHTASWDGSARLLPATWLNNERWTDEVGGGSLPSPKPVITQAWRPYDPSTLEGMER